MTNPQGTQVTKKQVGLGRMRSGIVIGIPIAVIIELVLASSFLS